jgi:hypothetical protein
MRGFTKIVSFLFIALFLVFSANIGSCITLHEMSSDSSSESQRDCPQIEFSARIPNVVPSQITHHQGCGSRYLGTPFNAVIGYANTLKSLGMREPLPAITLNRIQKTVLRI